MNRKAFTLIEVMVVIAIISIMASMMMPAVWKWWENEEIATTKERINDIKMALVGDRALVQKGIRTNYGYVGDKGTLPTGDISELEPYMRGGFDRSNYAVDAWGKSFVYAGYSSIRSYGPNGTPNDSDDIILKIEAKEIAPSINNVKGEIGVSTGYITSNASVKHCARIMAKNKVTGDDEELFCSSSFMPNAPTVSISSNVAIRLPIGELLYTASLHRMSGDCPTTCNSGTAEISTLKSYYFIQDDMKEINFNFPYLQ